MNKYYGILLIFFSIFSVILPQEKIVTQIGEDFIDAKEFKMRFEFTPRISSSVNVDSQKTHFAYTLIAEKLWAKEAVALQLDTISSYRYYISNLEKMLVRDLLFKQEIESKINLSEEEISDVLNKISYRLGLNFLYSKSKREIDSLYSLLAATSIDSLLENRIEKLEQLEPVKLTYGQMQSSIEDSLFNLNIDEYTKPIQTEIGWAIYYLREKSELKAMELGTLTEAQMRATKNLLDRKKQKYLEEYLSRLLSDKVVNVDINLFKILSDRLISSLKNIYSNKELKTYYLYDDDIKRIIKTISEDSLTQNLIKFETDPITLKEFLYYLSFSNFKSPALDSSTVENSLSTVIRNYIRDEIITREGYKRGLHNSEEVSSELKMWRDNYLSQYLRNTYNQSAEVTEPELTHYISTLIDSTIATKFVSVTEIKLHELDHVKEFLTAVESSSDIEQIVSNMKFPGQLIVKADSLVPLSSFGDLAGIINNMTEDEVYGPITRAEGYSILILHKVEERELSAVEKNKLQVDVHKELLYYNKLENILRNKTVELANKYKLKINREVLKSINVTDIPALIYRMYGFGGQTTAAPFTNLFYNWYYRYKSMEKEAL